MEDQQRILAEELLFSGPKKPSFAKMLYFGVFNPTKIFPFPKLSDEELAKTENFLEALNTFADQHINGDLIDRQASIPNEVIAGLGKLGALGMTIPEKYAGLGMTQYAYCKAAEIISRHCGATALFVNAHQSIGLKALLLFGTEEQKQRWLPPLAKGESLAAFALTEPNAGSDASGIETRAVFDKEKGVWRINGKKQWITNGGIAQVLTVMARTEIDTPQGKQDKITAFLVTPDLPGFKILEPALEKVGMRGSKTAILEFENLEVPAANVLGPIGGGLKICLTVLDFGRTTFGATCTGAAKYLVERAVKQAHDRYQFKRPLGSFALVKKKIATMSALAYAMDATTYMTAGFIDQDVEDFMLESAMLKVFTSDSLWTILYDTMQIFGGRSFFTEEPFERMMRDARLNMIGEGSNEVMRAFIGVVGMRDVGMQMKGVKDALGDPFGQFDVLKAFANQWWHKLGTPHIPVNSELIKPEADQLGKAIRSFGFAVFKLLAKYREDILEEQLQLDRIANAAMAIYTSTAVLSKLDSDLKRVKGNSKELGNDVEIAKLYCSMAFDTIENNLKNLNHNFDDKIVSLSDKITGIKYP